MSRPRRVVVHTSTASTTVSDLFVGSLGSLMVLCRFFTVCTSLLWENLMASHGSEYQFSVQCGQLRLVQERPSNKIFVGGLPQELDSD